MTSSLGKFFHYFDIESQKLMVEKFGTAQKKELVKLMKQVCDDYLTGKLVYSDQQQQSISDPDTQYKIARAKIAEAKSQNAVKMELARLRNIELDNEIKERNLSYQDTFGSNPSKQAQSAIKKGTEREFTQQESENISQYIESENIAFRWNAKCTLCDFAESYDTKYDMTKQMTIHLSVEHSKKVMEMRN